MNVLKTLVNQIESFGKLKEEQAFENCIIKIYRMDTVTCATIYYNLNSKPYKVSFFYH